MAAAATVITAARGDAFAGAVDHWAEYLLVGSTVVILVCCAILAVAFTVAALTGRL